MTAINALKTNKRVFAVLPRGEASEILYEVKGILHEIKLDNKNLHLLAEGFHVSRLRTGSYVRLNLPGFPYLHQAVLKAPEGYCVHHKNHNPLDCRESNLEIMSISEHLSYHKSRKYRLEREHRKTSKHSLKQDLFLKVIAEIMQKAVNINSNDVAIIKSYFQKYFPKVNFSNIQQGC